MKMTKSRLTEQSKNLSREWANLIKTMETVLDKEQYTLEKSIWSALDFAGFFKSILAHNRLTDIQWEKFIAAYKELHFNANTTVPRELLEATLKELRTRRNLEIYCH